jgi:hypothetical protein
MSVPITAQISQQDQPGFPLFLWRRVAGNRGILRRRIDGWLFIWWKKQQKQPASPILALTREWERARMDGH